MLIVNSFASSVTARNTVMVHRRLSEGIRMPGGATPRRHEVEVVETNRRGHATRFAHDAARRGVDVVIGFGGDGTLNEVATGIAGTDTALGVLPGGSTNVFARTLGMKNDPISAVERLVDGIDAENIAPIGLGQVNGRYFCFHIGIGFDAAVVQQVERHGSLKRWLGHPLFITAGLTTWARGYDRKRPHFTVSGDGGDDLDNGFFTIVLNTNPYTYLGNRPLDLSPDAGLDKSLVAITFTTMNASAILTSLAGALKGGGVSPASHLDIRTGVEQLHIHGTEPFPYQLDGDALGESTSLNIRNVPNAVKLVFPNAD
jgi:diacylglycerol kinase family enzyme